MEEIKLKIAMMGHKHVLSREGGVEIVVKELATRMVERGHFVTCFDRNTHHVAGNTLIDNSTEYNGVKIEKVWTIEKRGLAALTSSLSAAIKTSLGDYDIVHIHAEGPAAMCWIPKLIGKRVIVTIHGLDWAREKWSGFATKYIKWGERIAVRYADEIIVLSKNVSDYFKTTYNRNTVFIPNGVSKPVRREIDLINKLWGLKKNSYVLFLGRIVPEKGLRYLVEAWNGIRTEKKLVIAGGSSDTNSFMHELKEMANDSVIFTGFQEGQILEELYSNAYVYVLPSDLEGMPLSLLEAMSYGNCCLVSDITECTDVVEDKAVSFKKSDIHSLKTTLQKLLDYPECVDYYKKTAANYITNKYNWDDVVDKTLDLYRKA